MKAHLIDTHLLVPRSRSSAKVLVKYQGHVSQKMGVSGALVFHKHILFYLSLQAKKEESGSKEKASIEDSAFEALEKDFQDVSMLIGESNTVVSAYTLYRNLQQYCSQLSTCLFL